MEKKSLALREMKFAPPEADAPMSFSGYGAVFSNIDSYRDIIAPGAFAATLAAHKAAGTLPVMLWNHDPQAMPIGVWTDMQEDDHGLRVAGYFLDTQAGRDAYTAAKAGAVSGLSIGYFVTSFDVNTVDAKAVRTITGAELVEVSLVTFPANDQARVADVKSTMETTMNLKMQRQSLERLAELFAEAGQIAAKLVEDKSEDVADAGEKTGADHDVENAGSGGDVIEEAKYDQTAEIEAVRNLTLLFKKMETHGR